MSFYRNVIAAIAAMGLATAVFAEGTDNQNPAADKNQPAAAAQPVDQTAKTTADATQDKVNINKATAKELAKVKGMSATKAKAVVAYRKKHGEFKSLDDLKEVKGFKKMNEQTLKDIQDQLVM